MPTNFQRRRILTGGSPVWTPASLTPVFWLDASALTLADNEPITSFTDQSGNGRHFTASGTARATFKPSIVNGRPVARFDGVDDVMVAASTASTRSLGLVIRVNRSDWGVDYAGMITGNSGSNDAYMVGSGSAQSYFFPFPADVTFYKANVEMDETTIGAGPMNAFAFLAVTSATARNYIWQIGRDRNFAARSLNCDVAEVVASSAEWTAGERTALRSYFLTKYAV